MIKITTTTSLNSILRIGKKKRAVHQLPLLMLTPKHTIGLNDLSRANEIILFHLHK